MSDKHDKQFDPTPRRIEKAREDGNVFRAQELNSVAILVVGLSGIVWGMPIAFSKLEGGATRVFSAPGDVPISVESIVGTVWMVGGDLFLLVLPFMLFVGFVGAGLNVLMSGWNFTVKALEPKPERISVVKGFERLFSSKALFTVGKSIVKVGVVGPVAYFFIKGHVAEITMLHHAPLLQILQTVSGWLVILIGQILVLLLLLSIADTAFEKWRYKQDLKMSHKEIRDEARENEGDPQVRVRRRQFARELLRPRLDHAILKSDVVVTNPTHYAVALRYDPLESPAPRVLAKGIRKKALRIKRIALEAGIPVIEDRPLARALYDNVDETQEIPEELYPAVATVLAEIYQQGRRWAA